jgi:hypothetical protein
MACLSDYEFAYDASLIYRAKPDWEFGREPVLGRMPDGSLLCLLRGTL